MSVSLDLGPKSLASEFWDPKKGQSYMSQVDGPKIWGNLFGGPKFGSIEFVAPRFEVLAFRSQVWGY